MTTTSEKDTPGPGTRLNELGQNLSIATAIARAIESDRPGFVAEYTRFLEIQE